MVPQTIVVTGASGMIGRAVCVHLTECGHHVRALVRRNMPAVPHVQRVEYDGVSDAHGLCRALGGADAVVHLAARVHRMRDDSIDPLTEYRRVNTEGTHLIARLAVDHGVREILFASSVKAMGEANDRPWTEIDVPHPVDPYGISKLEAEHVLASISEIHPITTTVLRFPLVYGPGVKANMYRLFELVDHGLPLPLGGIRNSRSLLYAGNAAAAVVALLGRRHGHEVYFVSDGEDVSTPELIRRIARALNRSARLVPLPGGLISVLARRRIPRLSPIARRLTGSLTVDTTKLRACIGPMPFSLDDGLDATATWYRSRRSVA